MNDLISKSALKQDLLKRGFFPVIVKHALEAAPAVEQPQWISVEDRLPEKEERVLAWSNRGLIQICRYQYRYNIKSKRFKEAFYTDANKTPHAAKYWMPLPQPPKEDE